MNTKPKTVDHVALTKSPCYITHTAPCLSLDYCDGTLQDEQF